jgi:transposase
MSRVAVRIILDSSEELLLRQILRRRSVGGYLKERIQIVLASSLGLQNQTIAPVVAVSRHCVGKWRKRWAQFHNAWKQSDPLLRPKMSPCLFLRWLADAPGRGRKEEITLEQRSKIAALTQETPEQNDIPVTHWTLSHLASIAVRRGIVAKISRASVQRILKKTDCPLIRVDIG